jgi:broad specificity phosphatase PhoE
MEPIKPEMKGESERMVDVPEVVESKVKPSTPLTYIRDVANQCVLTVYVIRHGETESNAARESNSEEDTLTPTGMQQAQDTAKLMETLGVTDIETSPMRRAMETALVSRHRLQIPFRKNELLSEKRKGELETDEAFSGRVNQVTWQWGQLARWIKKIDATKQVMAVFTHSLWISHLISPFSSGGRRVLPHVPNGSVTAFNVDSNGFVYMIACMETGHLRMLSDPHPLLLELREANKEEKRENIFV